MVNYRTGKEKIQATLCAYDFELANVEQGAYKSFTWIDTSVASISWGL